MTHANIIIYDKKLKIMERFEPFGSNPFLDNDILDNLIFNKFKKLLNNFTYVKPSDTTNSVSFQKISVDSNTYVRKTGDPGGYCLAWTFWYLEMRINNPDLHPKQIITNALNNITEKKALQSEYKFVDFIRNYSNKLDKLKNDFLIKIKISNKYLNNVILPQKYEKKVIKKLNEEFENITKNWN